MRRSSRRLEAASSRCLWEVTGGWSGAHPNSGGMAGERAFLAWPRLYGSVWKARHGDVKPGEKLERNGSGGQC